MIDVAGG